MSGAGHRNSKHKLSEIWYYEMAKYWKILTSSKLQINTHIKTQKQTWENDSQY